MCFLLIFELEMRRRLKMKSQVQYHVHGIGNGSGKINPFTIERIVLHSRRPRECDETIDAKQCFTIYHKGLPPSSFYVHGMSRKKIIKIITNLSRHKIIIQVEPKVYEWYYKID